MRTQLSANFYRDEFECKCGCGFDTVDAELVQVLQDVRDEFDESILITSGCRCPKHNAKEGGATTSMHLTGKAADFVVKGIHADLVADYLESLYPDRYGIGRYSGRCHIDVRAKKARWDKR